jgi:hypothetical protein
MSTDGNCRRHGPGVRPTPIRVKQFPAFRGAGRTHATAKSRKNATVKHRWFFRYRA